MKLLSHVRLFATPWAVACTRLLSSWDFLGKSTGVGCHFPLQGILDGETTETVTDFILGGSKITADGDCSHEIKSHLLHGRKVMTKLDSILRSSDITLLTKVCLVKGMVFPLVMYGCESWTIKKVEH